MRLVAIEAIISVAAAVAEFNSSYSRSISNRSSCSRSKGTLSRNRGILEVTDKVAVKLVFTMVILRIIAELVPLIVVVE